MRRYTYVYDSGALSAGMDPSDFTTRKMTTEMDYIATDLNNLLKSNLIVLNLQGKIQVLLYHLLLRWR